MNSARQAPKAPLATLIYKYLLAKVHTLTNIGILVCVCLYLSHLLSARVRGYDIED